MTDTVHHHASQPETNSPNAGGWFDCRVNMAGPAENGLIYLHLADLQGSFACWFQAVDVVKEHILTTALTAIAHDLPVTVHLSGTQEYGTVNRLYAKR